MAKSQGVTPHSAKVCPHFWSFLRCSDITFGFEHAPNRPHFVPSEYFILFHFHRHSPNISSMKFTNFPRCCPFELRNRISPILVSFSTYIAACRRRDHVLLIPRSVRFLDASGFKPSNPQSKRRRLLDEMLNGLNPAHVPF